MLLKYSTKLVSTPCAVLLPLAFEKKENMRKTYIYILGKGYLSEEIEYTQMVKGDIYGKKV